MTVGFVMLVHTSLDRAAQTARHWAEHGKPIVLHVDKAVSSHDFDRLRYRLNDLQNVGFSERFACGWGGWSIVRATQMACEKLLVEHPDVTHVYLASGSCLPLRPVEELQAYLDARADTDFIESATTDEVDWTIGGLDQERFTLRFPFNWKRHRKLFDGYVRLQRRLKFSRKIPAGLTPHLGSQWWCLSRNTLTKILEDPRRAEFDGYFRRVWIPDESYFQTLSRLHSKELESRALTLAKFDYQGKPHVFYDDHIQLLRKSDCFVARKIWPRAALLYREFLTVRACATPLAEPKPLKIDRLFGQATERRTRGRSGLAMPGRFPNEWMDHSRTSGRYVVFEGFNDLFEGFETWLARRTGSRVHGNLFAAGGAQFAGGDRTYNGCLMSSAAWRDYRPINFLTNLIWNTRGEMQCFQFSPSDRQEISGFLAADRNADIFIITGAWAVPLYQSNLEFEALRKRASQLQRIENAHLAQLQLSWAKARVHVWDLAEFVKMPTENLRQILETIAGGVARRVTQCPPMADLAGFGAFLQNLKNAGMNPQLMGEFPVIETPEATGHLERATLGK